MTKAATVFEVLYHNKPKKWKMYKTPENLIARNPNHPTITFSNMTLFNTQTKVAQVLPVNDILKPKSQPCSSVTTDTHRNL
jgi:hypothetical protein